MAKCPREINDELYRDEWQWQEGDLTVTRNTQWSAPGCHNGCGVLHYTDKDGNLVPVPVKVGDKVVYGKFGGQEIKVDGEDLLILRADDLYGVFE